MYEKVVIYFFCWTFQMTCFHFLSRFLNTNTNDDNNIEKISLLQTEFIGGFGEIILAIKIWAKRKDQVKYSLA